MAVQLELDIVAPVTRPRHWEGDPDACGPVCNGPHHGDHLVGETCRACGGSAYACYIDTAARGCAHSGRGPDV
jgi:hypothetical protein